MGRAMNVPQDSNFLQGGVAITWNLEPQNVLGSARVYTQFRKGVL